MSSKSKRLGALADIFRSETLEGTIRKVKLTEIEIAEIQPRSDRTKGF
jgi:ParB family chromosome partitioning protein